MPHSLTTKKRQSFPKAERLHHKKLIQELFENGSSFYLYPFKVLYLPNPDGECQTHQVLVSVSKKKFKLAVERNIIKRRLKESYRLNKQMLYSQHPVLPPLLIAYIYTGKEIHPFQFIETKLIKSMNRLIEEAGSKND